MYPLLVKPHQVKLQPDFTTVYVARDDLLGQTWVNETGAAILCLCDGSKTEAEIVKALAEKYAEQGEKVAEFVKKFLVRSSQLGTITWITDPNPISIRVAGSRDYWTPDSVVIELTYNCPLSCQHCFLDAGSGPSLESSMLTGLCEELVALGVGQVQLTGGEPFLHPEIHSVATYLMEHGIRVTLATSGNIISSKTMHLLETLKTNRGVIQVSLDGFEETHNAMRGAQNSYATAIRFIQEALRLGVEVQVATCVTKHSIGEVEGLSGYLKDLGVRMHRIGVVTQRGRAAKNGLDAPVELRAQVRELRTRLREKFATSSFMISGFEDDIPTAHRAKYCGAGCRILKISPDGNVHPCPMMTWPIGSLKNETLESILRNSADTFAHLRSPSAELCGDCRNAILCRGCIAEGLLYCPTVPDCSWFRHSRIARAVERFAFV